MNNKAKERVAIAKDALAWVEAGVLIPEVGTFVSPSNYPARNDYGKQLRDVFLGKCEVCARGALFLAKAVRFDRVPVLGFFDGITNLAALEEHFDKDQILLIENYFEGREIRYLKDRRNDQYFSFKSRYGLPSERMTLILQNIIDNDGTFIPEKL